MSTKRPGEPLEQPRTKGPRSVILTDAHFESDSSESDSSESGDEAEPASEPSPDESGSDSDDGSDSGSEWNSDDEDEPTTFEGVYDLVVGQAIRAEVTVTDGGTETTRECDGVVDSIDEVAGGEVRARIRLCGTKEFGFITQGDARELFDWNCKKIAHPIEPKWVKFLKNIKTLLNIREDKVKHETTLTLVQAVLEFMTDSESMQYCNEREAYFEANDNDEMSEAWEENATKLDDPGDNIELLYRYVDNYAELDPAGLSELLDKLVEEDFPMAVTE